MRIVIPLLRHIKKRNESSLLTQKDLDIFIEMRICQLWEEGAKELLSRVVDEAREKGCGAIQITASDMGVLLYSNFGFVKNDNFIQYKL
ncbi:MAG: hypothetical protein J1E83_13105 [Lachnospiraceae bacterium]|nr:hypothetical protein [Lachnospiraceae bacterium]